jgi:hyperosmotically inducible periplasmic protein
MIKKKDVMRRTISIGVGIVALGLGAGFVTCRAASSAQASNIQQEPDNTSANKQGGTTADQQTNSPADRELVQKIRQSIASDKSLSTNAHNVKVIVRNGKVTLKGPVETDEEKQNIVGKAADLAGAENVTNKLTVK